MLVALRSSPRSKSSAHGTRTTQVTRTRRPAPRSPWRARALKEGPFPNAWLRGTSTRPSQELRPPAPRTGSRPLCFSVYLAPSPCLEDPLCFPCQPCGSPACGPLLLGHGCQLRGDALTEGVQAHIEGARSSLWGRATKRTCFLTQGLPFLAAKEPVPDMLARPHETNILEWRACPILACVCSRATQRFCKCTLTS